MRSNVLGRLRMMSVIAALKASVPSIGTGNTARARPGRLVHSGGTFNAERNAEKRLARKHEKELRRDQVAAFLGGLIAYAPKRHQSQRTVDMLSDRRLRQRGVAA